MLCYLGDTSSHKRAILFLQTFTPTLISCSLLNTMYDATISLLLLLWIILLLLNGRAVCQEIYAAVQIQEAQYIHNDTQSDMDPNQMYKLAGGAQVG